MFVHVCCFRWRNSFLFSLIFGIPVMIVMIYGMVRMAAAACPADDVDVSTAATVTMTTAAESTETCGSRSMMLLPGLSLENLLLFLLCTPCQVCLPLCCLGLCEDFLFTNHSALMAEFFHNHKCIFSPFFHYPHQPLLWGYSFLLVFVCLSLST